MRYLRQFIIMLILSMLFIGGIDGSVTTAAARTKDYKDIVVRASRNLFNEPMQHVALDVTGSAIVKNQIMAIAVQGIFDGQQKPLVAKGIIKVIVNTPSMRHEQRMPFYLEQTAERMITYYCNINGEWKKYIIAAFAPISNNNESILKSIKSISLVSEGKNTFVFDIIASQKDNQELIKLSSIDERLKPITKILLQDFKYRITVDKKKNIITKMSIDMSDLVAKIGVAQGEALKLPDAQKQEMKKAFGSVKLNVNIGLAKSAVKQPIMIPDEVRNAAKMSDTVGYVDMKRVSGSLVIQYRLNQITLKARELSQQLAKEKDTLSVEEFGQRNAKLIQEFTEYKKTIRSQIYKIIREAMIKVQNEKNLIKIMPEKPTNSLVKCIDVTDDVIRKIESAAAE